MFNLIGCPLLMACMCIERYLAVIRPVLYIRLRKWEYRMAVSAVVWVVTLIFCVASSKCWLIVQHMNFVEIFHQQQMVPLQRPIAEFELNDQATQIHIRKFENLISQGRAIPQNCPLFLRTKEDVLILKGYRWKCSRWYIYFVHCKFLKELQYKFKRLWHVAHHVSKTL